MTIKEHVLKRLIDSGFFPNDAETVFNLLKDSPAQSSMIDRWNHQISDYPPMTLSIINLATDTLALEYIKEYMPQAWFRPMFDKELAKELGI